MEGNENRIKKVPRSVVKKAYWYDAFFRAGGGFTYSMGIRMAASMGIILSSLYDSKEKIGKELEKYFRYYDTNVPFNGLIMGLVISMEERRAADPSKVPAETIQALQTSLMGPVGNIGDVIQQAIIAPLVLSIGIALCGDPSNPSILGPIFSMIATATATVGISYNLWMRTYDYGDKLIGTILDGGLSDKLLKAATILGTLTMGALISKYVKVTTSVAWISDTSSFILQRDFFDKIMPNMLSLITVFMFMKILSKGTKPSKVIWITMIAVILLAVVGVLGPVPTV